MDINPPKLTACEIEALRLLRKDHHAKELPALMHKSRSAVNRILQSARKKLGTQTSCGAMAAAKDLGLLTLLAGVM